MSGISKKARLERLFRKSITEWTKADFELAGYYSREQLAINGDPFDEVCIDNNHIIDLDVEKGILFLVCTKCTYTRFLKPKDEISRKNTPHVQPYRHQQAKRRF